MRYTAPELKNAFLAICERMSRTTVETDGGFDDRKVRVTRMYSGVGSPTELLKEQAATGIPAILQRPGGIYMDDYCITHFLNMGWEYLHAQYTDAISTAIQDKRQTPLTVEKMCYRHDQLYMTSDFISETPYGGGGSYADITTKLSRIFILPSEIGEFGPPTIVSCVIHDFTHGKIVGSNRPTDSRVCRLVGIAEISGLVNLATNSRYTSGALFRHRKFRNGKNVQDCIEVFHQSPDMGRVSGMFGAGTAIIIGYVKYPKPITVEEITNESKTPRYIEVSYPMEIAQEAAKFAMLQHSGNQGGGAGA